MNTPGKEEDRAETLAHIALAPELTAIRWTRSVADGA